LIPKSRVRVRLTVRLSRAARRHDSTAAREPAGRREPARGVGSNRLLAGAVDKKSNPEYGQASAERSEATALKDAEDCVERGSSCGDTDKERDDQDHAHQTAGAGRHHQDT
jgi:hypothetical protein